jgi:hypothetical protein
MNIINLDLVEKDIIERTTPQTNNNENDDSTVTTDGNYEFEEVPIQPMTHTQTQDAQPDDDLPPPPLRRSKRRIIRPNRYYEANPAITQNFAEIPDELISYMHQVYQADVENSLDTSAIDPLLPTPDNPRQILTYPEQTKKLWTASFFKELNELIRKGTVEVQEPKEDDTLTPVTVKFRVKLTATGQVDKLKTRIALRGDLMKNDTFAQDTWCPIAGFRALKIFLAFAAQCHQRVYQLDFVAAFLQADVIGRKFVKFPEQWKELLKDHPELHKWIGVPLRLRKSLYGDRVANLAWDETQSKWLTSSQIGFSRLPSEESIYMKRVGEQFITVLNAVDDQLYFATDPNLKEWFDKATAARFDVQFLGQANWYLQSRITQCADFSIVLDQSRYASLTLQKYLTGTCDEMVTRKMKAKYGTPIPVGTEFTKKDCSTTYCDVMQLQDEFGFEYAAAIGSLIYLMNTYIRLNYGIRKLARYMQYPGRNHFTTLLHLLRHLQCFRLRGGVKFYADIKTAPIYRHLTLTGHEKIGSFPIIVLSDASFQDDKDTGRSTGGYLIMMQGGVVDACSTMPKLVPWSTCEAEYCTASLAAMAAFFVKKVHNELHGIDPDHELTIPIGIDSQSAMDTANSHKETQRTRHFQRRYHFLRTAVGSAQIVLFKVDGTANSSNCLTKPLPAQQLAAEAHVFEVDLDA